jgi:uncharacterized protein YjbI with pentapeptide repeats
VNLAAAPMLPGPGGARFAITFPRFVRLLGIFWLQKGHTNMSGRVINWGLEGKTFWNWMELLFVPVVLASAAWFLDMSQTGQQVARENSRIKDANAIEDERNKIGILNNYRRSITDLVSSAKLLEHDRFSDIALTARALTISTLPQLGGDQKGALLRFLFEIRLVAGPDRERAVLDLMNADFRGAQLHDASLNSALLKDVNLEGADLSKAFLHFTRFYEARMVGANLREADLMEAGFSGAYLQDADFTGADLEGVDFQGAWLLGVKGLSCSRLQQTRNWESAYRDDALACGQPIPELPDERPAIIIEEITGS